LAGAVLYVLLDPWTTAGFPLVLGIYLLATALFVVSALDHRFGWSSPPTWLAIVGNIVVAAGLILAQAVVFQNNYAAATIRVEENQTLTTTGLYGLVRLWLTWSSASSIPLSSSCKVQRHSWYRKRCGAKGHISVARMVSVSWSPSMNWPNLPHAMWWPGETWNR